MPSQYDFKKLDRQITNLEKELSDFNDSFSDITTEISRARFNDKEYGSTAIKRKITNLVDSAKDRIASAYNKYINGMRRASHESLERIKDSANSASQYCEDLNELLEELNNLNIAFSNGEYQRVIDSTIWSSSYPSEIINYILLLKAESYDALCNDELKDASFDSIQLFKSYYTLCKKHNATKHLPRSASFLFLFSSSTSSGTSDLDYQIIIDGLKAFNDIPDEQKELFKEKYQGLYSRGVSSFNELCEDAYSKFDYIKVKSLLKDSGLFSSQDISNPFFKDGSASPEKLFDYASAYSKSASMDLMRIVFDDTKVLSNGNSVNEYLMFWISRYDDCGFDFIRQILNCQYDRFIVTCNLCDLLSERVNQISKRGNLLFDLATDYQTYLEQYSDNIPLLKFSQAAVKWANLIKRIKSPDIQQEQQQLNCAIETLDGLSYSMIVKYQKYCNCFDARLIDELNVVLDDSSNRLYGKPYRKDLKKTDNTNESIDSLVVKLVSVQIKRRKTKKAVFWILAIIVLLIIAAIIVILLKK